MTAKFGLASLVLTSVLATIRAEADEKYDGLTISIGWTNDTAEAREMVRQLKKRMEVVEDGYCKVFVEAVPAGASVIAGRSNDRSWAKFRYLSRTGKPLEAMHPRLGVKCDPEKEDACIVDHGQVQDAVIQIIAWCNHLKEHGAFPKEDAVKREALERRYGPVKTAHDEIMEVRKRFEGADVPRAVGFMIERYPSQSCLLELCEKAELTARHRPSCQEQRQKEVLEISGEIKETLGGMKIIAEDATALAGNAAENVVRRHFNIQSMEHELPVEIYHSWLRTGWSEKPIPGARTSDADAGTLVRDFLQQLGEKYALILLVDLRCGESRSRDQRIRPLFRKIGQSEQSRGIDELHEIAKKADVLELGVIPFQGLQSVKVALFHLSDTELPRGLDADRLVRDMTRTSDRLFDKWGKREVELCTLAGDECVLRDSRQVAANNTGIEAAGFRDSFKAVAKRALGDQFLAFVGFGDQRSTRGIFEDGTYDESRAVGFHVASFGPMDRPASKGSAPSRNDAGETIAGSKCKDEVFCVAELKAENLDAGEIWAEIEIERIHSAEASVVNPDRLTLVDPRRLKQETTELASRVQISAHAYIATRQTLPQEGTLALSLGAAHPGEYELLLEDSTTRRIRNFEIKTKRAGGVQVSGIPRAGPALNPQAGFRVLATRRWDIFLQEDPVSIEVEIINGRRTASLLKKSKPIAPGLYSEYFSGEELLAHGMSATSQIRVSVRPSGLLSSYGSDKLRTERERAALEGSATFRVIDPPGPLLNLYRIDSDNVRRDIPAVSDERSLDSGGPLPRDVVLASQLDSIVAIIADIGGDFDACSRPMLHVPHLGSLSPASSRALDRAYTFAPAWEAVPGGEFLFVEATSKCGASTTRHRALVYNDRPLTSIKFLYGEFVIGREYVPRLQSWIDRALPTRSYAEPRTVNICITGRVSPPDSLERSANKRIASERAKAVRAAIISMLAQPAEHAVEQETVKAAGRRRGSEVCYPWADARPPSQKTPEWCRPSSAQEPPDSNTRGCLSFDRAGPIEVCFILGERTGESGGEDVPEMQAADVTVCSQQGGAR